MNAENTSTAKDWMIFFVSTLATVAMLIWLPQWFWLGLPFVCTYIVKALRVM